MRTLLPALLMGLFLAPFAGPQAANPQSDDYSGMYTFLREGEFIQLTIEEKGRVTGFVSRFGDSESDHGAFLDQFIKAGQLDAQKLKFTTETVHGTWFVFDGTVARAAGKKTEDEGYFLLQGTLTSYTSDAEKKIHSESRQVEFKSFPRDEGN